MDIERLLVCRVVHSGELETVVSRGISEAHFADGDCQEVFAYIIKHTRRYNSPPSIKAVKQKFPEFEFEISNDALDYLIDQFIINVKRRFANRSIDALVDVAEDPEKAAEIDIHFLDVSRQLATIVPSTTVARYSDALKRIDTYHEDKDAGNVWGIKLGIPKLDELTFGVQSHELVISAGWQGVGKSTLMQFVGFNGYLQGKTVLFVSLEMESRALLRKFDAMAADLTYRDLKGLELDEVSIKRWEQYAREAQEDREHKDIIIIDRIGSRTAMGIYAETVRHQPDLVIVDYISLLDTQRTNSDKHWQKIGEISKELKLNARTLGVPVIAAAQTNRESVKEGGVRLETIAFSSSIGMDADIVLGLNQDDDMRDERLMEVRMIKNRDGAPGSAVIGWNMDRMQFGEPPSRDKFVRHHEDGEEIPNPFMRQ